MNEPPGTGLRVLADVGKQDGVNRLPPTGKGRWHGFVWSAVLASILTVSSFAAELITNGDFESGETGWTTWGAVITNYASLYRSETHYLWLGRKNNATNAAYQTVTIPRGATAATLSFYFNINSDEVTTTFPYDTFYVTIRNTNGIVLALVTNLSNLNSDPVPGTPYRLKTFPLLPYTNQTILIYCRGASKTGKCSFQNRNGVVSKTGIMPWTPWQGNWRCGNLGLLQRRIGLCGDAT